MPYGHLSLGERVRSSLLQQATARPLEHLQSSLFSAGGNDIKNAEHQRLKIEIWDHRLHINHFRGGCSILLKDILDAKRIRNTLRLVGVKQGELSLEVLFPLKYSNGKMAYRSMYPLSR